MKNLTLTTMLDRFSNAFIAKTGKSPKRSQLIEILAATLGYHNSNEMTAAASRGDLTPAKAERGTNQSMVAIIDPWTKEPFGLTFERLKKAQILRQDSLICAPSGCLIDISELLAPDICEDDALELPTALELSRKAPDYDPDHTVSAEISDDNQSHKITVDVSGFLAKQSDNDLMAMSSEYWRFSDSTDPVAFWDALQAAGDLKDMWDYITAIGKTSRDGIGFSVNIESEQAEKWLRFHRPHLFEEIMNEQEDPILFTDSRGCETLACSAEHILDQLSSGFCQTNRNAIENLKKGASRAALDWMPSGTETPRAKQIARNPETEKAMTDICEKMTRIIENMSPGVRDIPMAESYDSISTLNDMLQAMRIMSWPDLGQNTEKSQNASTHA